MDNPRIDQDGTKHWVDSGGKKHRDDGPAVIRADGYKLWYQHGKLHRDDGPAIIARSGRKEWYQHDNIHRDNGPAVEWPNGDNSWCLNNQFLPFDKWIDKVDISDENKVMMKLKYG
jgi:hypothetical protein